MSPASSPWPQTKIRRGFGGRAVCGAGVFLLVLKVADFVQKCPARGEGCQFRSGPSRWVQRLVGIYARLGHAGRQRHVFEIGRAKHVLEGAYHRLENGCAEFSEFIDRPLDKNRLAFVRADDGDFMELVADLRSLTQINGALRLLLNDAPDDKADALILIGDSFEEDSDKAARFSAKLQRRGIKIFSFIDGDDLPLAALCEGVALLASGGRKALNRLKNEKARLLLSGPSET